MVAVPPHAPSHRGDAAAATPAETPAETSATTSADASVAPTSSRRERKRGRAAREARRDKSPKSPKAPKAPKSPKAPKAPRPPKDPALKGAKRRQIGLVLASTHPRVALTFAVGTLIAAVLLKRTFTQALLAALAVLVVQMVAGLMNDVCDRELDRKAGRPGKRIATGEVPAGNATFIATALFLIAVPLSLQSGVRAGLILLATLLVAFLHNRFLHRTPHSSLGWIVTLPMVAAFVSYADREVDVPATAPPTVTIAALAFTGFCLHLITSLRDLPHDHKAGIKPLPLVIALKTGAPKLMYATIVLSLAAGVALIIVGLGPGLHR